VLVVTGKLQDAAGVLEGSVTLAAELKAAHDLWQCRLAVGKVLFKLSRESEAQAQLNLAAGVVEAIAQNLTTPSLRRREQPLRRAYELCERTGDPQRVLPALFQLDQLYIEQMRLPEARDLAERAVALAQTARDPMLESGAWHNLAETYFWPGDVQTARVHAERAIALCDNIPPKALIRSCGFDQWILTSIFLSAISVIAEPQGRTSTSRGLLITIFP
jgi:tetratricopeptide (TPR) repeat protein